MQLLGAPTLGEAWMSGDCENRVMRGRCMYCPAVSARAADRGYSSTTGANEPWAFEWPGRSFPDPLPIYHGKYDGQTILHTRMVVLAKTATVILSAEVKGKLRNR